LYSYREAEQNLGKLNCQPRSVNNHAQVKRITDRVGALPGRTLSCLYSRSVRLRQKT
jgi:hypothetical protein